MFKSLIKKLALAGASACFLASAAQAWNGGLVSVSRTLGNCSLTAIASPVSPSFIRIIDGATATRYVGGLIVGGPSHGTGNAAVSLATIQSCGFSTVVFPAPFIAVAPYNYADMTEISFTFTGTLNNGVQISNPAGGTITGDGTTQYTIAARIGGTAGSAPQFFYTVTEINPQANVKIGATTVADNGTFGLGTLPIGTAQRVTVTVESTGTSPLIIGTPTIGAGLTNATATRGGPESNTIAAGSSTTFTVDITPTAAGAFTVPIDIETNDVDSPATRFYSFSITGTASNAPEIRVTSPDVSTGKGQIRDGGGAGVNATTAGTQKTMTFVVFNSGTADLTIGTANNGMQPSANVSGVTYGTPGAATIIAGGQTTFTVSFTPTAAGALTVPVSFITNDADENPFNFQITGFAGAALDPEIEVSSSESGTIADGGTDTFTTRPTVGAAQSVQYQIRNTGNGPLTVSDRLSANAATSNTSNVTVNSFTLAANTVAPGANTTLTINYTVTAGGAFGFDWALQTNDPDEGTFNVTVVGNSADTPQTEFDKNVEEVTDTVQADVRRELVNEVAANQEMMGGALDRFLARRTGGVVTRNVPFDVDGFLEIAGETATTRGTFGGSQALVTGSTRFVFGDFNLSRDQDGSTTGQLSARVVWESELINDATVGYFIGGRAARSNLAGTFAGDASTVGILTGAYGIKELQDGIFGSAYLGAGYSWTDMKVASTTLSLNGNYEALSYYAGFQISGVVKPTPNMQFRPKFTVDYGFTDIGLVGFDATGFGTTSAVTSDFGSISLLETALTPEFLWFMGDGDRTTLSLAPSYICRTQTGRTSKSDCGGGIEFGIANQSSDGLTHLNASIAYNKVGSIEQQSLNLSVEMQF